jgi:hypothetical protein
MLHVRVGQLLYLAIMQEKKQKKESAPDKNLLYEALVIPPPSGWIKCGEDAGSETGFLTFVHPTCRVFPFHDR